MPKIDVVLNNIPKEAEKTDNSFPFPSESLSYMVAYQLVKISIFSC